jgi:hypothetical protein
MQETGLGGIRVQETTGGGGVDRYRKDVEEWLELQVEGGGGGEKER